MSGPKYYNHDAVWIKRGHQKKPVWGSQSLRVYAQVLTLIGAHAQNGAKKLLDIGCGAGAFGICAEEAGYSYCGIDESAVAIELGRKSYPGLKLEHVDFASKLVDFSDSFEILTAINSLHCLVEGEERATFLRQARELAQSDSLFVITTMCGPVTAERHPEPPRAYLDPDLIVQELAKAGWAQVLYQSVQPADDIATIPNLTIVVKP